MGLYRASQECVCSRRCVVIIALQSCSWLALRDRRRPSRSGNRKRLRLPKQAELHPVFSNRKPRQRATRKSSESSKPEEKVFKGMKYRLIGPFRGRAVADGRRDSGRSHYLLFRRDRGRSLEVDRRRDDVVASVRQGRNLGDWQPGGCGFEPQCHLCRHGRGLHPRQHLAWRRRLQVARWRQDLEERRPARFARDRQGDRQSRRIPTSFSSLRWDIPTGRTPSAASSARPTAARPGRRFCTKTRTPAASMLRSIRTIRIFCSRRCGRRGARPGAWRAAARAAGFIARTMAARPGSIWKSTDCPRDRTARSAWRWRRIPIASTR